MSRALPLSLLLTLGCLRTTHLGAPDGGTDGGPAGPSASVSGRVCTQATDPLSFPVKVVLLVDQSGSMCLTDPGGTNLSAFCAAFSDGGVPARARALQSLAAQLDPAGVLALVPYELNPRQVWPAGFGNDFAKPDLSFTNTTNLLGDTLGTGSDLQGALDLAISVVSDDIHRGEQNNPELLQRTRYVVLLVTDGVPYPRCTSNDALGNWASGADPSLTWPDDSPYCNQASDGGEEILGFVPGSDRNQNYQLFERVDQLFALKSTHRVADVRFHEVLLFNDAAAQACGPLCQDLYGTDPSVPPDQYLASAHAQARWLGQHLAARGNGVFEEFENEAISSFDFSGFDLRSLASSSVLSSLFAVPLTATLDGDHFVSDFDGDGLSDADELVLGTDPFEADTDGDGFDDRFEARNGDRGFDPLVKDARGCDPASPFTPGCAPRDVDGDGLSNFAEAFFETSEVRPDSDLDGITDGLEVRKGLNPLAPNLSDSDGDGVGDLTEVERGTDPLLPDPGAADRAAFDISTTPEPAGSDGTTCYDFTLSHLPLLDAAAHQAVDGGFNLYQLLFTEAPARAPLSLTSRAACVAVRFEAGHVVDAPPLHDEDFGALSALSPATYSARCVGWAQAGGP